MAKSNYTFISPYEFEKVVAQLFERMGYKVELTSKSGDYGIDVIARYEQDVIAIQTKKYNQGNNVGNRDVQRLLGAMQLSTIKANKGILITTSDFTVQAKEQAKGTAVELWNGEYFNKTLLKYLGVAEGTK
jgi:restriction system protein